MINLHSYAFDRDRLQTDWRAVSIAVVFHALLLAAFVLSLLRSLATAAVERTMFVQQSRRGRAGGAVPARQ